MRKKMSAYDYVINRLAAREYSERQLRTRMRDKGYPQAEIDEAIERAQTQQYQDDARFAASYVRQKAEISLWGKQRVRMGLIQAGIDSALIDEVLSEADWDTGFLEAYYRKYGNTQPANAQERNKRLRHMAGRGFPPRIPGEEELTLWEDGLTWSD